MSFVGLVAENLCTFGSHDSFSAVLQLAKLYTGKLRLSDIGTVFVVSGGNYFYKTSISIIRGQLFESGHLLLRKNLLLL